ncbi:MAG: hypothetical protein WAT39_01800 [Planctomycetota bacterium]
MIHRFLIAFALAGSLVAQNQCISSVSAPGCGPTATITFTPQGANGNNRIDLTCNGLHPNGLGLMVWGQTPVNIPFGNCPLLVEFQWGHLINLDSAGSYSWSRVWPWWADGYYYIQFGSILDLSGQFTLLSTDRMRAECN